MNVTTDLILIPYRILGNGTKVDWTKELEPYGYRTMWQIIWSCVLTMIACTWVTIHPNIPANPAAATRYRVHLWIVDLILPELLLLWATKQGIAACKLKKGGENQKETKPEEGKNQKVTLLQAFFTLMGGYEKGRHDEEAQQDHVLPPYYLPKAKNEHALGDEIRDKNKRSYFLKFLAALQTLWFFAETFYRIRSPILYATEAEVITVTFAGLSVITTLIWWRKPKDVDVPFKCYLTTPIRVLQVSTEPKNSKATRWFISIVNWAIHIVWSNDSNPDSPNCCKLATSMLWPDSETDGIYTYDGGLSSRKYELEMTLAVLWASICGSLCSVFHLKIGSLNGGLTTTPGRIWFGFAAAGSALSFYMLLVSLFSIVLLFLSFDLKDFLDKALGRVGKYLLFFSAIGRLGLIGTAIYLTFFSQAYSYGAFLTPNWSQVFLHPF